MNSHGNGAPGSNDDPRAVELARLFARRELRDEAAAPAYERLLERPARARAGRWRLSPVRWATAAALLLALAALAVLWRAYSGSPPASPTLATWRAPTDFLLAVPGGELLDSTPAFPDPHLPTLPSGS